MFLLFLLDGMCGQSWELLKLRPKDLSGLESVILRFYVSSSVELTTG